MGKFYGLENLFEWALYRGEFYYRKYSCFCRSESFDCVVYWIVGSWSSLLSLNQLSGRLCEYAHFMRSHSNNKESKKIDFWTPTPFLTLLQRNLCSFSSIKLDVVIKSLNPLPRKHYVIFESPLNNTYQIINQNET